MKTIDERIENLSDELLARFTKGVATINCGPLLCGDCPLRTDDGCLCVKLYDEHEKRIARTNEETVAATNTELEAKAQELVKQLDHLVELLSKF